MDVSGLSPGYLPHLLDARVIVHTIANKNVLVTKIKRQKNKQQLKIISNIFLNNHFNIYSIFGQLSLEHFFSMNIWTKNKISFIELFSALQTCILVCNRHLFAFESINGVLFKKIGNSAPYGITVKKIINVLRWTQIRSFTQFSENKQNVK